jgi:acetyltransferase-like isoleucine patch superfamily enzyme
MLFHTLKFFVGIFAYLDSRIYMKLYNRLLRVSGFRLKGIPRFIAKSVRFDDFELITLGDRVVISSNVRFLTHDYSFTTGLIALNEKPENDIGILGPIKIGNNVFIGMNSIILPGTLIGDNVIIGAGSVVRGIVESDSVICGNPAVKLSDIQSHTKKIKARNYIKRYDKK